MSGDNGPSGKHPEVGDALVAALGFEPATRVADREGETGQVEHGAWQASDGPQIIPDPPPPSRGDAVGSAHGSWPGADGSPGGTPAAPLDLRPTPEAADSMSPPKGKGKGPQKLEGDGAAAPLEFLPDTKPVGGMGSAPDRGQANGNGYDPSATVVAEGSNGRNGLAGDPFIGRPIEGFDYNAGDMPPPSAAIAAATGELRVTRPPESPPNGPPLGSPMGPPSTIGIPGPAVHRGPQPQPQPQPSSINAGAGAAVARAGELAQRMPQLLEDGLRNRSHRVRARKVRRVIRHIDPWSVLTFSVLFHLCVFASLLLASVLVWNAAVAAGTIENIESFIRELGDYETFQIKGDVVFRAAMVIAGILTLASSVLAVLLTVVFNLISDLVGGIRVTVVEEETVRVRRRIQ